MGDYAEATSFDTFAVTQKFGNAINPRDGIAALASARFVPASESDSERRISEAKLKALTGGETIKTSRLYENEFAFEPKFKIWLSTNHEPQVRGTDDGIWRRIYRVNFDHQVAADKTDPKLLVKLQAEGSGILNWLLEGLRHYQAQGLAVPATVRRATASYRADQSPYGKFVAECCECDARATVKAIELYDAYRKHDPFSQVSETEFGTEMGRLFEKDRSTVAGKKVTIYRGLRLVPTAPFDEVPAGVEPERPSVSC
jgi:putative DNA primase/helicase